MARSVSGETVTNLPSISRWNGRAVAACRSAQVDGLDEVERAIFVAFP